MNHCIYTENKKRWRLWNQNITFCELYNIIRRLYNTSDGNNAYVN